MDNFWSTFESKLVKMCPKRLLDTYGLTCNLIHVNSRQNNWILLKIVIHVLTKCTNFSENNKQASTCQSRRVTTQWQVLTSAVNHLASNRCAPNDWQLSLKSTSPSIVKLPRELQRESRRELTTENLGKVTSEAGEKLFYLTFTT